MSIIQNYLCYILSSPLSGECVQPWILGNFRVMNFLYPIGFTLGCELVILVCKSYLLFFLPPHFSSIKLVLEQVFLVDLSKLSLRFLNTLFIYYCEVNGLLCVQKIF